MKLNTLVKTNKVTAYGFAAFKDLEKVCANEGCNIVISALSPAIMRDMEIYEYFAPVLKRGIVFDSVDDVINADLDVQLVTVCACDWWDEHSYSDVQNKVTIVSRHLGTIEILQGMYPKAHLFSGNVAPHDITGKYVIGTLPPSLVQYCESYRAVTIKGFDYSKDKELSGDELKSRIVISDPVRVIIEEANELIDYTIKTVNGDVTVHPWQKYKVTATYDDVDPCWSGCEYSHSFIAPTTKDKFLDKVGRNWMIDILSITPVLS